MGFAEEVKQVTSSDAFRVSNSEQFETTVLPTGGKSEAEIAAAQAKPVVKEEAKPAKVVIAGKEFGSMEEALAFAQTQYAKAEGAAEVLAKVGQPAKQEEAAVQAKSWIEEVEDELFVDPKAAIKKLTEKLKEEIESANEAKTTKQKEVEKQEADLNTYWNSFYDSNKDLVEAKDAVDFITQKNWVKIKDIPLEEATELIASETRKLLRLSKEAALPVKEMPAGPARVAGVGQNSVATVAATPQKGLDFIAQLNKHRKRG